MSASRRRVCVIGLDGVPAGLLRRLAGSGVMPRVGEMLRQAHLRDMKVTLPEVSSVSWTSFMTGAGPGTHGIYGYTDFVPGTYRTVFPTFSQVAVPTIWDRLGRAGLRSVVVNQPSTYPARPLRGVLVSGFVALDLKRAVFPPRYLRDLASRDYRIDVDTLRARHDHPFLLEEIARCLESGERALDLFWEQEDWSYFELVITGTDRLQHFLWHALEDAAHPLHDRCLDYYRRVDAFCGRVFDRLERRTGRAGEGFFMLSDHGFSAIRHEVYLNAWLRREGYLLFGAGEPESLEQVAPGTRAFALDPGRIYLHRRGRFPAGHLDEAGARATAREIAARLGELEIDGERAVQAVFDGAELYQGPCREAAPDLVALGAPGYDLKATVRERQISGRSPLTGMHTWDDAFLLSFQPLAENPHITELARPLVEACGVPWT